MVVLGLPANADEDQCDCEGYFQPVPIHYVLDDVNGVDLTWDVLTQNAWQLREVVPVYDMQNETLAPSVLIVVLGEPSYVQAAMPTALGARTYGIFVNDEPFLYSFEEYEAIVDDVWFFK